ncbi:MAG: hypothetical protein WBO46_20080 [Caldilineaceae bacterium]
MKLTQILLSPQRLLMTLVCAVLFSGIVGTAKAQDYTIRTDAQILEAALTAYVAQDFFEAAMYFQAYVQRNPSAMRSNSAHKAEIEKYFAYSVKAVRGAVECLGRIAGCSVNSDGLVVSRGMGLYKDTVDVVKPPSVNYAALGVGSGSKPSTTTTTSSAETPYAVVCLVNKTNRDINYSYRWGDNEWKSQSVSANSSRYHSWTYAAGSHSSPDFRVRYDADFTSGTDYKQYVLKRYRNSKKSCNGAKKYEFKDAGGSVVGLYGVGD